MLITQNTKRERVDANASAQVQHTHKRKTKKIHTTQHMLVYAYYNVRTSAISAIARSRFCIVQLLLTMRVAKTYAVRRFCSISAQCCCAACCAQNLRETTAVSLCYKTIKIASFARYCARVPGVCLLHVYQVDHFVWNCEPFKTSSEMKMKKKCKDLGSWSDLTLFLTQENDSCFEKIYKHESISMPH